MHSRLRLLLVLFWIGSYQAAGEDPPSKFELPSGFDLSLESFSLPYGSIGEESLGARGVGKTETRALRNSTPTSREHLLEIQESVIEVARKAKECTVALELGSARGSGVVISEDGYILTAMHVVMRPGQMMRVKFADGRITKARALGLHTPADGALAKITEDFEWPFAPLASRSEAAQPGDWCVAVGHPGGFDLDRAPPVRLGRVIKVYETVLQTDCTIMGGDSGGPLFDLQGRVIGIHSRISKDLADNLHVPSDAFHEAWDKLVDGKKYPKPIASKMLALLDTNNDGMLTKEEQESGERRRLFDRLVDEFELDDDEISVKQIAREEFEWTNDYSPTIIEIGELEEPEFELLESNYVRGNLIKQAMRNSLHEAEDRPPNEAYVNQLTVCVFGDGRRLSLGTIVDADGLVVTKASRLDTEKTAYEEITCQMPDGTIRTAQIIATDDTCDLALLKVAASNLTEPIWNMTEAKTGQFAILPGIEGEIASQGIVGVPSRKIRPIPARMGISLGNRSRRWAPPKELRITEIFEESGAKSAGLQVGDLVLKVDGKSVKKVEDITSILNEYRIGDDVPVLIERGDEEIEQSVVLKPALELFSPMMDRFRTSGRLSVRRGDFASAFQIDAPLKRNACGGPVLDLNGHLLGVALARASRVGTYVIGCEELQLILDGMRSKATSISTTQLETSSTK